MADNETVSRADHEALQARFDALSTEHAQLKTTHGEVLATAQSAAAERDAASVRIEAWGQTVNEMVMAPMVERLVDPAVAALLPQPTLDPATGRVSDEWRQNLATWEDEHKSLFKPATAAPAVPTGTPTVDNPGGPAPANPRPRPTAPAPARRLDLKTGLPVRVAFDPGGLV